MSKPTDVSIHILCADNRTVQGLIGGLAPRWRGLVIDAIAMRDIDGWLDAVIMRLHKGAGRTDATIVLLPATVDRLAAIESLLRAGADTIIDESDADLARLLEQSVTQLTRRSKLCHALATTGGLLGTSPAMRRVRRQLAIAAENPGISLLLLGETGTGKFLAARALHHIGASSSKAPFHALDCGAITESLFGSELFGHVRGAFTGAERMRLGAFAAAGDGMLLLDEVGELPQQLQASFLTCLQERAYRAVGSDHEAPIRCRIVAATNRDLPNLIEQGAFRADLFHRLGGLQIELPPLRDRREDIPALFSKFLNAEAISTDMEIDDEVLETVAAMPLTGNVRELEAIARYAAQNAAGTARVRLPHLPLSALKSAKSYPPLIHIPRTKDIIEDMVMQRHTMKEILEECSRRAVSAAVTFSEMRKPAAKRGEHIDLAGSLLGISRRQIYNKLDTSNDKDAALSANDAQ